MSDGLKTFLKWVGYLLIAIAGGAGAGVATTAML